jgi:hypothetical protein
MDLQAFLGCAYRTTRIVIGASFLKNELYDRVGWDTREMAIERYRDPTQTHFAKKIVTYLQANREERHIRELGSRISATTVTRSAARVERMLAIAKSVTNGRGLNMACPRRWS